MEQVAEALRIGVPMAGVAAPTAQR